MTLQVLNSCVIEEQCGNFFCWCLRMLVDSFIILDRYVNMLICLGWVGPLIVLLPYIVYRINYENEKCWMDPGWSYFVFWPNLVFWCILYSSSVFFLATPVLAVITLNVFFLCQVITILKSKLETESNQLESSFPVTVKSTKAVLLLIPIFGLQFLLLPIRPSKGSNKLPILLIIFFHF